MRLMTCPRLPPWCSPRRSSRSAPASRRRWWFSPWCPALVRARPGQVLSLRERGPHRGPNDGGRQGAVDVQDARRRRPDPARAGDARRRLRHASTPGLPSSAQPPTPEADDLTSLPYQPDAWWYAAFPGLALAITALGFNLIGDGLRDWLDPLMRESAWMSYEPVPEPAEHEGSGDLERTSAE
jgi:hypothetical protein